MAKSKNRQKEEQANILENINALQEGIFRSEVFPLKLTQRKGIKILNSKQMLTLHLKIY